MTEQPGCYIHSKASAIGLKGSEDAVPLALIPELVARRNKLGTHEFQSRWAKACAIRPGTPCPRKNLMGSTTDKIKGHTNEAVGKAKQGIGKAIGDDKMRVEGEAQEVKGDVQKTVGSAKSAVKDAADKVADEANEKL